MKYSIILFVLLSSVFFSCKKRKEERIEQFGHDLVAYCDTVKLPGEGSRLFPNVNSPLFVDVNGISYLLISRIKENGPGAGKMEVKVMPQLSDTGVTLYTLQLKGPVRGNTADFLMLITLYYNSTTARFEVIDYSGGMGCG